jgi:FixJ family two-component response regulator
MAKPVSETGTRKTIFLVDDDAAVLKALSRVLRGEGWGVEVFASAEAFLSRSKRPAVGCLVLDVSMPGLDGLELQRRLAETGDSFPIIFVTGHGDIPMSVKAIKAGASDFLTKPVRAQALVVAIRTAMEEFQSEQDALAGNEALRQRFASLTPREREVLAAVTAGRRSKQIAYDLGIVEQTVKFHRARILERMQATNVAELVHMVSRLGFGGPTTNSTVGRGLDKDSPSAPYASAAVAPAANRKVSS